MADTSIAEVIAAKLAQHGLVPKNGVLEVKYVAVVRVTLANGEGVETVVRFLDNVRENNGLRVELVQLGMLDAEQLKRS